MRNIILLLVISVVLFQVIERQCCGIKYVGASPYNMGWDGTSLLVRMYSRFYQNVEIINSWFKLYVMRKHNENSCNVILIVSPEKRYNQIEKFIIRRLVYSHGYNIAILDEGPYANELLSHLDVPISIKSYNYIRDVDGDAIVQGRIVLSNISMQIYFAYASPISIHDESVCKPVAFVNNTVVGGICNKFNRRFLIIGDGSIVTNSVVEYESALNPYIKFSKHLVSSMCDPNDNIAIFIDSSKYRVRLATISELIEQGYEAKEILRMIINPATYFFALLLYINELISGSSILYIVPPIFILIILLAGKLLFKEESKYNTQLKSEEGMHENVNRGPWSNIAMNLCALLREFEKNRKYEAVCRCLSSRFKRRGKCVRELEYMISSDKELRKRILRMLSTVH